MRRISTAVMSWLIRTSAFCIVALFSPAIVSASSEEGSEAGSYAKESSGPLLSDLKNLSALASEAVLDWASRQSVDQLKLGQAAIDFTSKYSAFKELSIEQVPELLQLVFDLYSFYLDFHVNETGVMIRGADYGMLKTLQSLSEKILDGIVDADTRAQVFEPTFLHFKKMSRSSGLQIDIATVQFLMRLVRVEAGLERFEAFKNIDYGNRALSHFASLNWENIGEHRRDQGQMGIAGWTQIFLQSHKTFSVLSAPGVGVSRGQLIAAKNAVQQLEKDLMKMAWNWLEDRRDPKLKAATLTLLILSHSYETLKQSWLEFLEDKFFGYDLSQKEALKQIYNDLQLDPDCAVNFP